MKQIYHPAVEDITVEGILYALSDPVRVRILIDISRAECSKICSEFLQFDNQTLPKSTLSQHLRILRESGLIISERKGVKIHNRARCEDLEEKFGTMLKAIFEAFITQNTQKKLGESPKQSS